MVGNELERGTDPVELSLFISIVLAGGFVRKSIREGVLFVGVVRVLKW